ncbi:MAG: hypothetical protein OXI59_13435 [Gemmatimonadota bacterium]|nr:hypothetical protein [Gemmatimonadota bacterium]
MNFLNMFDKLDDIIYKPIELITNWASEPLKSREHKRREQSADRELQREIERKTAKQKITSEIKMKERELEANIEIKKETKVVRIIAELEEWKKDQDFKRMKDVSEAIIKYQKALTQLNVDTANDIGNMQIDLREKAQNLVYEKTIKYKELQDTAMKDAREDLKRIETDFPDNEAAQKILNKAVEDRLENIINVARNFLQELNDDIRSINRNIDLLTDSGQKFIERHLSQFHALGFSDEEIKRLKEAEEVEVEVIEQESQVP